MLTKFGLPRPPQPYKICTTFSPVKKFRFQARILFKSLSFVIFDISPIARPIFSHGLPPLRNQMALSTPPSLTKKVSEIEPEESKDDFSVPPSDNSQAGFHEDPKSVPEAPQPTQDQEWVSGFKLLTIMTAVSLVCLLMLLDTSIIVTAGGKALSVSFPAKM